MDTPRRFRAAVDARDLEAIEPLLAPGIRLLSPVTFTPFEGKDMVLGLFKVLLRTFEDFHYIGEHTGQARTSDDLTTDSHVLLFQARVGDKKIHGIDLLHLDEHGLITEMTVMVRPRSAVHALGEAVLAGLVADGLVPDPER
ncbi:nuclear transport factor 2 family protein [Nocardiopsis coralli]|uniref:nuclear transport factor 2 family protein n=1 Tax=Nocardiopsis coralli TaxID=2772213 RepID=UPI002E2D8987|nr:nuclear transport factor 2 family protein [Nocardiopsis coralli]